LLPERVEAGIDGEAVDPGGHRRRIVEVLDASVHLDEDFLGLVLGIFPAAHQTVGGGVHPPFQLPDKRLKGARVLGKGLLAQADEGLRRQRFPTHPLGRYQTLAAQYQIEKARAISLLRRTLAQKGHRGNYPPHVAVLRGLITSAELVTFVPDLSSIAVGHELSVPMESPVLTANSEEGLLGSLLCGLVGPDNPLAGGVNGVPVVTVVASLDAIRAALLA
jgi:hypothetical protein